MAQVPTAATDPTGLAALVSTTVTAVAIAVGVGVEDAAQWALAAVAVVNLAAFVWARRHAWAPAQVWDAAVQARREGAAEGFPTDPPPERPL